jgi:hypothetical protein
MKSQKSYCNGLFCNPENRKMKCEDCGLWVCSVCSADNKCVDCYIESGVKDFKNEFTLMLKDLDKLSDNLSKKINNDEDYFEKHKDNINDDYTVIDGNIIENKGIEKC